VGLGYFNFPHDASFAIVPLESNGALSLKSKYRYMTSPFSHRLDVLYQLFFNDGLEDNAHNALVDTVMLAIVIIQYIERVDTRIE
jgi:hypothetical protein